MARKKTTHIYFGRDGRKLGNDEVDWIYVSGKPLEFNHSDNVAFGWDELYCTKVFRRMCGFAPRKGPKGQVRISVEKLKKLVEEVK